MFNAVISYWGIVCLWVLSIPHVYFSGALLPLAVIAIELTGDNKEPPFIARALNRLAVTSGLPLLAFGSNWFVSKIILTESHLAGLSFFWKYVVSLVVSFAATLVLLRFVPQATDKLRHKLTARTELERNRRTDVRDIAKMVPAKIGGFDPEKYFPKLTSDDLFIGLDEHRKPVYISYKDWTIQHGLLTGRSRSGKGVAAQILLSQAVARGEYVVILDPKLDNYLPHIFKAQCEKHGKPYRFINLNQEAGPQCNLFEGCSASEIENILIGGFGIGEKGGDSDFYKLKDRRCARAAARWFAENPGKTVRDCVQACAEDWSVAEAFREYMLEMAELPSVNRPSGTGGIDIAEGEKTGGVLYVVGDMINTRILRMQRMVLLRLLFLVKNRDQLTQGRTICVLADEFRVHISPAFMVSLGASAGWGLHCVLAMQSVADLANVPKDLDKEAVKGSVFENTSIKISYAIEDPDTAELVARTSGKIQVDDESRKVRKNVALAETVDGDRTIRQAERYYFDDTIISNMPKACAMLKIPGKLACFCFTAPVNAGERTPSATTPTVPPMPATASASAASGSVAAEMLALDDLPATPEINEEPYPDFEPDEPAAPARGGALDLD